MSFIKSYQEIINHIDTIDPVAYGKSRNHLRGAVTQLSPYISRGIITLPQVRDQLLVRYHKNDCAKLLQELAWREYFQNVWWAKGDEIFSDLRFPRTDWRHEGLVTALVEAETGIDVLDEAVKELYLSGYMHNHARMWVASVACNIAGAHWLPMGKWLYYHLYDGDLASNFLSWQWVAGTSVNKRYTVCQSLINQWSDEQQLGTWLSVEREETLSMPLPSLLADYEPFALTTPYPEVMPIKNVVGEVVCLYTPWTLDPVWRIGQSARRILVIEPRWFDRFPVSDEVLEFIIRQGQTVLPDLEVFIGDIDTLPGIIEVAVMHSKAHPTNQHWPGEHDARELLHPEVTGYYPSFYKYWQQIIRS